MLKNDWCYAKKGGFTLAEVLITLGIIGIVAALTLPALIQNKKEKELVTRTKKVYSVLNQAYLQSVDENGTPDNWELIGSGDSTGSVNMMKMMSKYLKVIKLCLPSESFCFPHVKYNYINGNLYSDFSLPSSYANIIISDGTVISFEPFASDCQQYVSNTPALKNVCGSIFVDINGDKGPNVLGIDMLSFYLSKNGGIIPRGTAEETGNYAFENSCSTESSKYSYSCAAWIIYNENMDYLHCDDLSWDGKLKCSK